MEGEYCHECGGSDKIQPEYEKPDILSPSKKTSGVSECQCDECGQWIEESKLKDGLCKNCDTYFHPPKQVVYSMEGTVAGYIDQSYKSEATEDSYSSTRATKDVIEKWSGPHSSAIYGSEPVPSKLYTCVWCRQKFQWHELSNELCTKCYHQISKPHNPFGYSHIKEKDKFKESSNFGTNLCLVVAGFLSIFLGLLLIIG
jgi:hypothetical protein